MGHDLLLGLSWQIQELEASLCDLSAGINADRLKGHGEGWLDVGHGPVLVPVAGRFWSRLRSAGWRCSFGKTSWTDQSIRSRHGMPWHGKRCDKMRQQESFLISSGELGLGLL